MTQGWKKAVSVMLCAAMILSMSSVMISADELNQPTTGVEQTQPENENTNETPEKNKENTDNNTTEGETPNTENEQTSEAVKNVIAQLEALPKLDDLTEATDTQALKNQVESAKAAFDALTEEEKASISEELKGNLADLDIFVTNFIVNTPTAIPEEENKVVADQDNVMTLEEPIALIGDGTEADPYQVDSAEELAEALKKQAQDTVYIQLNEDITTKTTFEITNKTKLMMGSHSIVSTEEKVPALTIKEEVTLENGKISSVTNGVEVANNGNLIVVGTEILATKNHAISMTGGSATINSGSMKGGFSGIALLGGKSLTVEGGNISGAGFGITGNGNYDDTEIVIKGGIITGEGACAIFHPQAGNLTIKGGNITGTSGVQYCGAGNLTVTGGTITGTYQYTEKPYKPDTQGDGSVDDGAAISIVSRGGGYQSTGDKINVSITGGNLISEHNAAVTAYRFAKIGGKWVTNDEATGIENYLEKLEIGSNAVLKGNDPKGTLEIDEKAKDTVEIQPGAKFEPITGVSQYLDPAYTLDENGVVVVGQENVVATVDGKGYATVQDAINNADGKTVVLNKDTTETVEVPQGITVTLDLNGKTLKEEKVLNVEGNLTVKDSAAGQSSVDGNYNVSYQSGKIVNIKEDGETQEEKANRVTVCVQSGGTFTLESGTLESKKNYTVEITDNAHAVINGGYQVAQEGGPTVHGSGAVLDVNGGVIEGIDNSAVAGNGKPGLGGTTINITGGTLIGRIQSAGYIANAIYHPQNGVLNITGGTIYAENGVGILMRNGELNVSGNPSIIATGNVSGWVGDKKVNVPSHAVVLNHVYGENDESGRGVSITGGEFISDDGLPSVSVTQDGVQVKDFISGGSFSNHVDPQYLSNNLNAELYSPNRNPDAPFSYYPSVEDAKDEAEQFGGTIYDENGDVVATIPAPSKPNPKPEKPSKPSNGGSSNSGSSNSGTTVDKEEEDYNEFWDKVIDRINKADEGDTVTVHAGNYDKMPNKVMKALEKNGVGLIIKYNGGEIEIPAGEAVNKSNKLFWSFKELGNYVFAVEDNNEQNDKQDNEQSNGSENNAQSNTTTEQKPSGTVETKPNPQTGSEDYVGLAAALAVTAGVAATVIGAKKKK